MHTLTINVNDSNFERVISFLKSENVDIVEERELNELDIEPISKDDSDYQYILEAREKRANGEKGIPLEDVLKEFGIDK